MKNLTVRYSVTQFSHWAASSGAAAFATTYLLGKGIAPGVVGLLLALAGLASCFTQPLLAGLADRARDFLLVRLLIALSVYSGGCYVAHTRASSVAYCPVLRPWHLEQRCDVAAAERPECGL